MATGNFDIERRHYTMRSSEASQQDRIVVLFFGLLAAYSVFYLLALSHMLQV